MTIELLSGNKNMQNPVEDTINYYLESPDYLKGPFSGTCHFGYTQKGEKFELQTALHSMEILLGETIAMPPGSCVLDAGCGYGRVATTLNKEFGYAVTGIDLIHTRLEEANRFAASQAANGVNIVEGSYCTLPLSDSSFSAVFTMETLVHAYPLESALAEFWRVLKPGGRLVLFEYSVPDRKSLGPIRQKITDIMVQRTGMASIERFTHDAFPSLLTNANFENITVTDISRNVWPTWYWLFKRVFRGNLSTILTGKFMKNPNIAGKLFIWPYRHQLGYKVVTAIKPTNSL